MEDPMSEFVLEPLSIEENEIHQWSSRLPWLMRFASFWATYSPRGRGAIPHRIGRLFGKRWKPIIQTVDNEMIAVDSSNLEVYTTIMRQVRWDPWVVEACIAALHSGNVFYDIGASAGYVSVAVAKRLKDVEVLAFEPQTSLSRALAISARINGLNNLRVFTTAIGEQEGIVQLHLPSHSVHASLVAREPHATVLNCPITSLDQAIGAIGLPVPHVLKIDVEGAEFQVFRGAKNLLRNHTPTIIFESDVNCERFGYTRKDILSWLRDQADYVFFRVSPGDILASPMHRSNEFRGKFSEAIV
jgi:FkbM family methyltransferase